MRYGVVIAGGWGKRLWPKSRKNLPKYLLKINGKSLLQGAVKALKTVVPTKNILVVTNNRHTNLIRKELRRLPKKNVIGEPVSKNTAPAICLAAALINRADPEGIIFIMPSDQILGNRAALGELFSFASLLAKMKDSIITIGIKPAFAATGYGYIRMGRLYKRLVAAANFHAHKVDRFIEKPSLEKAKGFLKSNRYCWNSGIFIGKARVFLSEFKRHSPGIYKVAQKITAGLGSGSRSAVINRYYKKFPDISIDYAVMEKTNNAYVIKADILWDDMGSWLSFAGRIKKDKRGTAARGRYAGIDVKDSFIIGEKNRLITAIGLDGFVIAQAGNATLICPKDRAQDVKKLVELIEKKGLKRYL